MTMQVRKFQLDRDLNKLETYLRNQYSENRNMTSWLPERLHDLIYRMGAQEADGGRERSMDYIFLWEEKEELVACILPDGENIYMSMKKGFEYLYPSLLSYSEQNCLSLFHKADDGSVKFWVAANDSLTHMQEILKDSGYSRYPEEDYDNCVYPLEAHVSVDLPDGFQLLYGEEYGDEMNKWNALHLGFHPDHEESDYQNSTHRTCQHQRKIPAQRHRHRHDARRDAPLQRNRGRKMLCQFLWLEKKILQCGRILHGRYHWFLV